MPTRASAPERVAVWAALVMVTSPVYGGALWALSSLIVGRTSYWRCVVAVVLVAAAVFVGALIGAASLQIRSRRHDTPVDDDPPRWLR